MVIGKFYMKVLIQMSICSMFATQQPVVGTPIAYVSTKETDNTVLSGLIGNKVQLHCITFMKEYADKSLEELRYEDYALGRKGKPAFPLFGSFTFPTPTPTFGQVSTTTTNSIFGTNPTSTLFPSLTTPNTSSIFGNSNTNNVFGGFQTKSAFPFGTVPAPQPLWGNTASPFGQNLFGTPTSSMQFNLQNPQFQFPTPVTASQPQPFTFNWPNANTSAAQQAPQTFANFAKQEKEKPKSTVFGQPTPAFGFAQPAAPTFAFGQPAPTFGQTTTLFGQPTPQPQPFAFGQPQQPFTFGQPQQPFTFGQPQQPFTFGQPQQPFTFGQPQQPFTFGQGQQQQPLTFGQPQQPFTFGQWAPSTLFPIWPPFGQQASTSFGQTNQLVNPFNPLQQPQWCPPGFNPTAINFNATPSPTTNSSSSVLFPPTSKTPAQLISCTPYPECPPLNCDSATFARHLKASTYNLLMNKSSRNSLEMNKTPSVRSYAFRETFVAPASLSTSTNVPSLKHIKFRTVRSQSAASSSSSDGNNATFGCYFGSLSSTKSQTNGRTKEPVVLASNYTVPNKAQLDEIRAEFDPFFTPPTKWKTLDLKAIGANYQNDIAKRAAERAQNPFTVLDDNTNNNTVPAFSWRLPQPKGNNSAESVGGKSQTTVAELEEDEEDEMFEVPIGVRPRNYQHTSPVQKRGRSSGVKLTKERYYCKPRVSDLDKMTDDYGNCFVENFTVGHLDWGDVIFEGQMNVGGLDLDKLVSFGHKEFCTYPNDDLPKTGEGLNRTCIVTLKNVWPAGAILDGKLKEDENSEQMIRFEKCLHRSCIRFNGEFISYSPETGIWVFKIKCFPE